MALALFKVLTFKKILNAAQLLLSYYFSKITKQTRMWGVPYAFAFEPTTSCNLRCPQCPSGLRSFTRNTGTGDLALFKNLIDQQKDTLIWLTLYFQGEPYLNPDFLKMVAYAKSKKIFVSTSTNAHYLSPQISSSTIDSGLDRIIVSVDGASQATYEKYRVGGKIETVWTGLRNLTTAKKEQKSSIEIILQFIVFKHNEHELTLIKQIAHDLGVKLRLKTAQVYDEESSKELLPQNKKYRRYSTESLQTKTPNACWRMWHSAVSTWDGNIVPCCFDKDATHTLGNIEKLSLKDIWKGNKYQSFREQIFKNRKSIDICKNCSEGSKVFL